MLATTTPRRRSRPRGSSHLVYADVVVLAEVRVDRDARRHVLVEVLLKEFREIHGPRLWPDSDTFGRVADGVGSTDFRASLDWLHSGCGHLSQPLKTTAELQTNLCAILGLNQ